MKFAIHHFENSFSVRWIEYCNNNNIEFKLVDCFSNSIINDLQDCDALLWNWYDANYKTKKFAKQLTYSVEKLGKIVFPSSATCWHYDDKIGQKYLLEAVDAPFVPTYIFYDSKSATEWTKNTTFPKVFKLSTGSGANNVQLAFNRDDAHKLISKAFASGFSPFNRITSMKDKFKSFKKQKNISSLMEFLRSCARLFVKTEVEKFSNREIGYVYFQEFIPNNNFDIRIVTTGDKVFGIKRYCRENDFRASGSGVISYKKEDIDIRCVEIALETSKKLGAQSLAYDFVFDNKNNPLIIEISYTYTMIAYDMCEGYWDGDFLWHEGKFSPQKWMIENVINDILI